MLPAATSAQDGQHALAEPVGLLQVRVPGQDELGDAERGVLFYPVGDLGVAADQGRARAAAPGRGWPGREGELLIPHGKFLVAHVIWRLGGKPTG